MRSKFEALAFEGPVIDVENEPVSPSFSDVRILIYFCAARLIILYMNNTDIRSK